jgi:adenosylcobinamide-GDP ribazoletransferase
MRQSDNIKAAANAMAPLAKEWPDDLIGAVAFLTRVPMPHPHGASPPNFARAHRAFPLIGAAIGAVVGAVYSILLGLGLPALGAAACALGASALLTGGLHEDGLADVADGFGGGRDKAAKLEIMRDSRLGSYGALALLVSFGAKASALAALPQNAAIAALIAAHALARGILPAMAMSMPYARSDGLAAAAGRPEAATAAIAVGLAVLIAFLALPIGAAVGSVLMAAISAVIIGVLASRQIGGQTGDVLGCAEQVAETAILLLIAASRPGA